MKRGLLFIILLPTVFALNEHYDDICMDGSDDICLETLKKWNESMRDYHPNYMCSSSGESIGWTQGPFYKNYIWAYKAMNDTYWLERFVQEYNAALCREPDDTCAECRFTNETYDDALDPELGWYHVSDWYSIDGVTRFDFIVGEGILLQGLAEFIEVVYDDPALHTEFKDDADHYLELAEEHLIPKWDRRGLFLTVSEKSGVYLFQNHSGQRREAMSLPHNQMQEFTQALMIFYRITGDVWYKTRADEVHQFYLEMIYDSDGYWEWHYWDPAGPWDYFEDGEAKHWINVDHKSGYSAIVVHSVFEGYRNCITFTETDMQEIMRSIKHKRDTQSGWYIPMSGAWLDEEAMQDNFKKTTDPGLSSWQFLTGGTPEFYYMMHQDTPFYGDCHGLRENSVCPDGVCNGTETCRNCPEDCGDCCPDEECQSFESCSSCPDDCGVCPCTDADIDISGRIEAGELLGVIQQWKNGGVSLLDLLDRIGKWKNDCE